MKALVLKELKSIFCSATGAFFAFVFLAVTGVMLWFFPGRFNLIDSGYASMSPFFELASILYIILIPALTMRLFAEEKRSKTYDILLSRPVRVSDIYISKFISVFVFVFVTLIPTFVYCYSLYQLANPVGNIDMPAIVASYISLFLLIAVFIAIGLLGSAVTRNQIVAFIIAVFISIFAFYGFNLLGSLFSSGKMQILFNSFSLSYHYESMQRGVIDFSDVITIFNYLFLLFAVTFLYLSRKRLRMVLYFAFSVIVLNAVFLLIPNVRLDFTSDKRYTISNYTKSLLNEIDEKETLEVNVYLNGDLNYLFQNLNNSVNNLLSDYNRFANGYIKISNINPYQSVPTATDVYEYMANRGMSGIMLNEVDREGKASRKVIYPYAEVNNGQDTLVVPLLKNITGNTAGENINASIEGLEFEFTDAIRLLSQKEAKNIAFIEGHGELSRAYVYDAEELLSKYYYVNRGQIGDEVGVLDDFEAVIIAGPQTKYSEAEKYIIDQYIMNGGKVLWLVDGVYYSSQELKTMGRSASMKSGANLDDILFTYGVRINPDLIQDKQCLSTYLITDENVQMSTLQPDYYQPLLMPTLNHPVTKNIQDVKAVFASSIDIVNNNAAIKKDILLTTSVYTHLVQAPDVIDFDIERIQNLPNYFNQSFIPVAVSLDGEFNSAFTNRPIPDSIVANNYKPKMKSRETKMIVVSASSVIANEIQGIGAESHALPMGYDRVSQVRYGNGDFIVNAVNWLTDDDELTELRTKRQRMYMLNRETTYAERKKYFILNIGFSIIFMFLVIGGTYLYRKRKYEK